MAPIDRYQIVFIIFFIHGIGTLVPWNMIINAYEYFVDYKLSDDSTDSVKTYRKNFLSYLGIASKVPNLLFQILNTFASEENWGTLSRRIKITLIIQTIFFVFTIMLAIMDTQSTPVLFFWLTIISTALVNTANGVYQGSVFGLTGTLPMRYTNAVAMGMNFSGVLISIANIVSIAIAPDPKSMAIIYFSTAIVILLICLVSEFYIQTNEFYSYYRKIQIDLMEEWKESSKSDSDKAKEVKPITVEKKPKNTNRYLFVLKKIYTQLLDIFLIYFATFAIFPPVMANIESIDHPIDDKYFGPIFCFLAFNVFDLAGTLSAHYIQFPTSETMIAFTSVRLLLIPFYLFFNYQPKEVQRSLVVIIESDWIYLSANILLALSNGHLSSLCLMYCPHIVPPQYSSIAGMMSAFTILIGILSGMFFSLIFPEIV